ncbi:MAG: sigma-70 family RNA polymerase sigma factor [Oscillospiraceae bacterium]|nr:sigma-70 family RNA polymerase sigma factor [Oscillospiraceae bacterium]
MTNEELAEKAAAGDAESMNALYAAVAPLAYTIIRKYFPLCEGRLAEPEDLIQCGYFAVHAAARAFNPGRGVKFNSILHFHVQNECRRELGIRGKKQPTTISLSQPVNDEEDITLQDTLEDGNMSIADYAALSELQVAVREEVNELTPLMRYAVIRHYFFGEQAAQIARELGRSRAAISETLRKALYRLTFSRKLQELWAAFSEQDEPSVFSSPEAYALAKEAQRTRAEEQATESKIRRDPPKITTQKSGLELL